MTLSEGRKRLIEAFDEISNKKRRTATSTSEDPPPLQGVVVCLTGLTSVKKVHLHGLIEKLGGRWERPIRSCVLRC
jgi:hypothetical protein